MNKRWGGTGLTNLVVVLEDEVNLRQNLEYLLKAERFRTMLAPDGMAGLALIRRHLPKVVVLDMYLPHMSGFEVIDDLRGDPILENIFVIAMTGMADDPDDLRRLKGRADVIMPKPLDEDYLIQLIRAAFKNDQSSGLRRHVTT
jgi:DNA-binding response OmpR family regulator